MNFNQISSTSELPDEKNGQIHTILSEIRSQQDEVKQEIRFVRDALVDIYFQQKELKSELCSTRNAVQDIMMHIQEIHKDLNQDKGKENNKDNGSHRVSLFRSSMIKARMAKMNQIPNKSTIAEYPKSNTNLLFSETDSSDTEIMDSNGFSDSKLSFVDKNNTPKPVKKDCKAPPENKDQPQDKKINHPQKKDEFKVPPIPQKVKPRATTQKPFTSTPYKRELGRLSATNLKFTMPSPVPTADPDNLNKTRSGRVSKQPTHRYVLETVILKNYSKSKPRKSIHVTPKKDHNASNIEKNSVGQGSVRKLYSPTDWSLSNEFKELEKTMSPI